MSQQQATANSPQPPNGAEYGKLLHNTALFALVACPVLALLPPRKLDFYTFGLVGATGFSANYLTRERTGRPITQYIGLTASPSSPVAASSTPKSQISEQPTSRIEHHSQSPALEESKATGPVSEAIQTQRAAWKAQREKEIREDVEEGKGFGDMIIDQVWEVWNWGKPEKDNED